MKKSQIHYLILLFAGAGMLGSLYYSNFGDPVQNFRDWYFFSPLRALIPCHLCWYARLIMYPMVLISLVGIWKNDKNFVNYIFPLSILGILLEIYHYSLQMSSLVPNFGCSGLVDCSETQVLYFGFISIPLLALINFVIIAILSIMAKRKLR